MGKIKNYLTTGQAAAIFDVDPDTVLRWIKSGDIPAIRTPGGHYRISRNVFLTKMIKDSSTTENKQTKTNRPYCWEYHSREGMIKNECKNCIVYTSRTSRCYKLCHLPVHIGHAKIYCPGSCEDCQYFRSILHSPN